MKNNTLITLLAFIFSFSLLAGCTAKVRVIPYEAGNEGIAFTLPKSLIQLKIPYIITPTQNKEGKIEYIFSVKDSVDVDIITVPDPDYSFIINTDSLASANVNTKKFKAVLSESGYITYTNGEYSDKTSEIIQGFTSSAFNIAKMATGFGVIPLNIMKDLTSSKSTEVTKVTVVRLIDPTELSYSKFEDYYCATYNDKPTIGNAVSDSSNKIIVSLKIIAGSDISDDASNAKTAMKKSYQNDKGKIQYLDGLPYRLPTPIRLQLSINEFELEESSEVIAQSRKLIYFPIKSRAFTDRTTAADISEKTGGVTKYEFSTTSSAENIANMLETVTEGAATSISEVQLAKINQEIKLLQKQKEYYEKKKALLDAKKALENAE